MILKRLIKIIEVMMSLNGDLDHFCRSQINLIYALKRLTFEIGKAKGHFCVDFRPTSLNTKRRF